MEGKSYIVHCLALSVKHFLHFLVGIVDKYAKKNNLTMDSKNEESGGRNVRFEQSLECSFSTKSANLQGR